MFHTESRKVARVWSEAAAQTYYNASILRARTKAWRGFPVELKSRTALNVSTERSIC